MADNTTDAETSTVSPNTTEMDNTTGETTTEAIPVTSTASTCLGAADSYPVLSPPTLTSRVLDQGVRFDCTVQEAEAGSLYYVTWTTDGSTVRSQNLTGGDLLDSFDTTGLDQAVRQAIISKGVTCSVQASNPDRCGSGVSPAQTATLDLTRLSVVGPAQTVLQATTETSLTVSFQNQVTPQFYCALLYGGQTCEVQVEVKTSQTDLWKCISSDNIQALSVFGSSSGGSSQCGTTLSTSSQTVRLRPSVDNIVRGATNVSVDVKQVDVVDGVRIEKDVLGVLTFTVESSLSEVTSCRVYADPHVITFDGTTYDVMRPGRFLVYKNTKYDLEVEGYFFVTGNGASACGFGIRSGDDVIRVSKCDSPMSTKLFLTGNEMTPHTKVYQEEEGNKIKVFLPTGTLVIVTGGDSGIVHLEIRPSALDVGQTTGLCGSYDGNATNDLTSRSGVLFTLNPDQDPNDFSGSWSVEEADSLYGGFQGTATFSFTDNYCSCPVTGNAVCTDFGFVVECGVSVVGTDITQTLVEDYQTNQDLQQTQQILSRRRRRQTTTNTREVFAFDPNFNASASATWPTASGLTQATAQTTCENAILNTKVYTACAQHSKDNFATEISNCVTDIKLNDNLTWANAMVQTIQQECGTYLAVNSSMWEDANPSAESVQPSLDATAQEALCPSQCSGHGTCTNGVCGCSTGFGGTDCSFQVTLAPTVMPQNSNSLCQSNLASCNRTFVRGENFIENVGKLTCHLTPIQVDETGIVSRGITLLAAASYRSQYEVVCDIASPGQSYAIKVSNDRQSTSLNEALFVVYDSTCFTCNLDSSDPKCNALSNTCLIGGQCYRNGDTHPTDTCQVCSPVSSYNSWSANSVSGCQTTTQATTTDGRGDSQEQRFNLETLIIAASLSSVAVALIIIAVVVYCVRRNQRRSRQRALTRNSEESSSYGRVYEGSFGVRTGKRLEFRNPTRIYDYYVPTTDQ